MLPKVLIESLQTAKGFEQESFEAVHASGERVSSIRLNPAKNVLPDKEWNLQPIPWCVHGKYLSNRPSFTLDPLLHAGAYYVQEASSMFLWHVLQQIVGGNTCIKVLDLCAAPGGKSSLLASYFFNGMVVANEVIKNRVQVLAENITKWGSSHVVVTNNDPSHFQSLQGYFDLLVVDAPCSGSGLFRKDPEAVQEWSVDNVQLCCQRQQRILADALPALKENGILIYSTCSYSMEENESIADWLVSQMNMQSLQVNTPADWGIVETSSAKQQAYGYRFYPNLLKGEGFFIAAFQKTSGARAVGLKQQQLAVPSRADIQQLSAFIPIPEGYTLFSAADGIRAIAATWFSDLQILAKYLYIKKAGTAIGALKGKDIVPSHELALSGFLLKQVPVVVLQKQDALQYLKRKDLSVQAEKGWNLVDYCGLLLGWIKVLPNRINNYYPAEWRILKD